MRIILICGAFGGGTSAVAELVWKLGALGLSPWFQSDDPRTINTYESLAFRDAILAGCCEKTMTIRPGGAEQVTHDLMRLKTELEEASLQNRDASSHGVCFLKYPLSALFINQINDVFKIKCVYVVRNLEDIERSRLRRGWPMEFGALGAGVIYRAMWDFAQSNAEPIHCLTYEDLVRNPMAHAASLAQFCGLTATEPQIADATNHIRRDL